jgi:hypothetical protein
MARLAILLAVLALPACADLALILPEHPSDHLLRGCETRPPVGACSPAAGAFLIRHRTRF